MQVDAGGVGNFLKVDKLAGGVGLGNGARPADHSGKSHVGASDPATKASTPGSLPKRSQWAARSASTTGSSGEMSLGAMSQVGSVISYTKSGSPAAAPRMRS